MKNYDINQIVDFYFNKKHTITQISNIIDIPFSTIKYQLKKHEYILKNNQNNGNNRRCSIDADFFKLINKIQNSIN